VTSSGDQVTYQPPASPSSSIDTFSYVVGDANGHTATGVVMVKDTAPFQRLEAESAVVTGGSIVTDGSDHSGTGYAKLTGTGSAVSWTVDQPSARDVTVTLMTRNSAAGHGSVTVDGGAPVALSVPAATAGPEGEGTIWTPVTTTVHLSAGRHTLAYSSTDVAQQVDDVRLEWPDAAPAFGGPVSATARSGRAFAVPVAGSVTDPDLPADAESISLVSPYSWWRVSGATLTGTAPGAGTYSGTLVVTDASGLTSSTPVTLVVTQGRRAPTRTTVRRSGPALVFRLSAAGRGIAGELLSIQRWRHHRWVEVRTSAASRRGVVRFRPHAPGTYRAVFAGDDTWSASASRGRRL
jgi:hypothetical protein